MIIDASVVYKVLVEEEGTEVAKSVIADHEGVAPHLILSEVGNALWKAVRRRELRPHFAGAGLSSIPELLTIVDESFVMPRAAEIAVELDHPIYDCVYLALAEHRAVRLITADRRFLKALAGSVFEPLTMELSA